MKKTQNKNRCRRKACRYGYAWRRTSGTTTRLIPRTLHWSARWWVRSDHRLVRPSRATIRWRDYQEDTQTHQDNDWPSRKHPLLEMLFTMTTEHWKDQLLQRLFSLSSLSLFISIYNYIGRHLLHLWFPIHRVWAILSAQKPGGFAQSTRLFECLQFVCVDICTVQLNVAKTRRREPWCQKGGEVWGRDHYRRMTDKKRDLTLDFFRYDANSCGTHDRINSFLPHACINNHHSKVSSMRRLRKA